VKFPDNSLTVRGTPAYVKCYSQLTHIMLVLTLLSVVGVGMQQCMIRNQNEMHKFSKVKNGCKYAANNKQFYATFPSQDLFPDTSQTFSKIPDSCQIPRHFQVFQKVVILSLMAPSWLLELSQSRLSLCDH